MKKILNKRTLSMVLASGMLLAGCSSPSANDTAAASTAAADAAAPTTAASAASDGAASTAAPENGSDEPTTLTVWINNVTPERTEGFDALVAAYMAEHPNVTLEVTALPGAADDKVIVSYEAGQGPDVLVSTSPEIGSYINGNYIIPLDPYFDQWEKKDDLLQDVIDVVRTFDITGNNGLYYLPLGSNLNVFWIRKDWVEEVGGDVTTWEGMFDTIAKMTDKEQGRYGLSIRGGAGGARFLERMMYSYSGLLSVFDENGKTTINDPKNVEFVERYLGMYNVYTAEGDINYSWTEMAAAFDSGAAGLIMHNLGSAPDHVNAFEGDLTKFAAVGMPLNELGTSVNMPQNEVGIVISTTCENPDAAFDFASYLASGEPASEYARLWSFIPVDQTVMDAEWLKEWPWFEEQVRLLQAEDTVYYDYYPWLPDKDQMYTTIDTEIQYVMAGEMTAQELCDHWAELMQKCYDDFFSGQ